MALTQTAWITQTQDGHSVATCNVTATTAEHDAYTLPLPKSIDCTKQFTLLYTTSATPDGQALPFDVWVGFGDSFVLSGDDSTVAATNGAKFKQIFDDVVLAVTPLVYTFVIDPLQVVADVVTVAAIASGPKVRSPKVPRMAFNANGGSTLAAVIHYFTVIQ